MPRCRYTTWLTFIAALVLAVPAACGQKAVDISKPFSISAEYGPGSTFMQVRLRGVLRLMPVTLDGLTVHELSGLAWDADEGLLYAISDDGFIVHLRPAFAAGVLHSVSLAAAYPLLNPDGRPVAGEFRDSEGLTARNTRNGIRGDAELIISFEVVPRLARYTPAGLFVAAVPLPPPISMRSAYTGNNNELEALTEAPGLGLITAPERPLKSGDQNTIPLYSLSGQVWHYVPVDPRYSALVGLETMPDGDLLVLERRYASVFRPLIYSLRRMRLSADPRREPVITDVVRFDTSRGWAIDNFESVAWHEGSHYFMVSDDNRSLIQKTLLLYIEILEPARPAPDANQPSRPHAHDPSAAPAFDQTGVQRSSRRGINSTRLHGRVR